MFLWLCMVVTAARFVSMVMSGIYGKQRLLCSRAEVSGLTSVSRTKMKKT